MMNNLKLIAAVKDYPLVYNQHDKSYGDLIKKEHAWREISIKMDQPDGVCKKQWNNLRDAFRRRIRKRKETKCSQDPINLKKWKYEDEMSFLLPHFKEREPAVFISRYDISDDEKGPNSFLQVPKKKSKNNLHKTLSSFMKYVINESSNGKAPDEIDLFFSSMASTVKRLSPYNQAIAKARIFSTISELEMADLIKKQMKSSPLNETEYPTFPSGSEQMADQDYDCVEQKPFHLRPYPQSSSTPSTSFDVNFRNRDLGY